MMKVYSGTNEKDGKEVTGEAMDNLRRVFGLKPKRPLSKCQKGECANAGCKNSRRHASAYCQPCSDKHNA